MKSRRNYIVMLICAVLLSQLGAGCATMGKGIALGGTAGAGVGAIAGGLADPGKDGEYRTRNVLIGTAVGGVAGLIAGAAIQGSIEDQKKDAFRAGHVSGQAGSQQPTQPASMPGLTNPRVEVRWVEPKVAGNRYIEGHYEYVIVSPARWEGR